MPRCRSCHASSPAPVETRWIAVTTIAVAAVLSYAVVVAQEKAVPDLTGTWVLNAELSDTSGPPAESEGERGDGGGRRPPGGGGMGGPGGGMGRPGGMGSGGGVGAGGEMPDRAEIERMRAAMEAAMRVPARLTIVKAEPGLIVTDDQGVSTRLALDGKKETGASNGVPFESTTKWEEAKLRVERKFKGGLKLIEHYVVSGEPRRLTITAKIEGGRMRGGRATTRVYDQRELAADSR